MCPFKKLFKLFNIVSHLEATELKMLTKDETKCVREKKYFPVQKCCNKGFKIENLKIEKIIIQFLSLTALKK